jgi:hypothetical protein
MPARTTLVTVKPNLRAGLSPQGTFAHTSAGHLKPASVAREAKAARETRVGVRLTKLVPGSPWHKWCDLFLLSLASAEFPRVAGSSAGTTLPHHQTITSTDLCTSSVHGPCARPVAELPACSPWPHCLLISPLVRITPSAREDGRRMGLTPVPWRLSSRRRVRPDKMSITAKPAPASWLTGFCLDDTRSSSWMPRCRTAHSGLC